jgi:arylsulfatase A-like enzyme
MWDGDDNEVSLPGYRVDALTDAMIRYLDTERDNPFMLMTSFIEPHHQNHIDDYPPPDGYRERYAGRWVPPDLAALGGTTQQHLGGYYGMVTRLDEALGRVYDALKSLRILDNTIILFFSDHGCHFKTRNREYKRSCHESSIRIPCMLHGGPFVGGGHVDELVSLVDLPPTLLDAAGIDVPDHMQGRSMLPLVDRGRTAEWPGEVFFETSEEEIGRGIRTADWKYHVVADAEHHDGRGGASEYREAFLYDMNADPYELCNLVGRESHRALCDQLQERLQGRIEASGQSRITIQAAEPRTSGQRVVKDDLLERPWS